MKKNKKISASELGAINSELIQKHGEGANQIIQAFIGKRYDSSGNEIVHKGRNLDDISNYKIGVESNVNQQAGFSAELVKESRDNRENIISGNKQRTRTTDGVGKANDPKHDHVTVDQNGNIISQSGSQMKVYGTPEKLVAKLGGKKWEKYLDDPIDIPSEQVEAVKKIAQEKAKKYREQAEKLKVKGKIEESEVALKNAEKMEKIEKNVRDSGLTREEALQARVEPKKFIAKEIMKDSHGAGMKAAKGAVLLSGAISLTQNIYQVINKDKTANEACIDVGKDMAIAGISAYFLAGSGTLIKGIIHSSEKEILRKIGNTNIPAMIVTGALEIFKSLKKYANEEINETQLLQELGQKGTGVIAASYGGALGTFIFPGIGTVVGSMIGYTVSEVLYNDCINVLRQRDLSRERRIIIEEMAEEAIIRIEEYKKLIIEENNITLYERDLIIKNMSQALNNKNIEEIASSINSLGKSFGKKLEYSTLQEFDEAMNNQDIDIIL